MMHRCNLRHEKYKADQAKDIMALSGIKIKIRQENLQDQFLKAAYKYAVAIFIQEKNALRTKEKRDVTAHRAVIDAIGTITDRESAALCSSRQALLSRYATLHSINVAAHAVLMYTVPAKTISTGLLHVLFGSRTHLILYHEDKDAHRIMNSELEEFLEDKRSKEANDAFE